MTESKPQPESPKLPSKRVIESTDLFQGQRAIVITHSGEEYRLTITRNDKLILQK